MPVIREYMHPKHAPPVYPNRGALKLHTRNLHGRILCVRRFPSFERPKMQVSRIDPRIRRLISFVGMDGARRLLDRAGRTIVR